MRLAYLTTEYPKVSHTFIRRELCALEARGHSVLRTAIRPSAAFVDDADRAEFARTFVCLAQSPVRLGLDTALVALRRPVRFVRAVREVLRMGRLSERGVLRHVAYLVEAATLLRRFRREGVEHVHVHFGTNSAAVALLVARLGGPPYSLTVHGPDEFDAPLGGSLAAKVREARFVAAISSYGLSQLRRWTDLRDWHKLHVVRCTVGDDYGDAWRPIDPASRRLVSVGRLSAQKGQAVLLEAFAQVVARGVDAELVLVGDGELRPQLEADIAARGLGERVTITGWADEREVRAQLLGARAFVLPSFAEGLPVVIMEALALARPVISTWIAGVPELVVDGESGWLVAPSDAEGLAAAMAAALALPADALDAMGAKGRARVAELHSTSREAAKLDALVRASATPANRTGDVAR